MFKRKFSLFISIFLFITMIQAPISAQDPSLELVYPNGGEELIMGTGCIITWISEGDITNVKLEYSTDGGGSYHSITTSTENDGAFTWDVPVAISSNCLVKITDSAEMLNDMSNATFSIVSSMIMVTYPGANDYLRGGWDYDITWTTTGTVGNVKIEYSSVNVNYLSRIMT